MRVYVANTGDNSVTVIDPAREAVVATVPVGQEPHHVLAPAVGRRVYVGNYGEDAVSVHDADAPREIARVRVGRSPTRRAETPDGRFILANSFGEHTTAVIEVATHHVGAVIGQGRGGPRLTRNTAIRSPSRQLAAPSRCLERAAARGKARPPFGNE